MIISNIKNFKNGWMIGNFEPSLLKTQNFEVGVHVYLKNFRGDKHYHTISTEFNYIINGEVIINGNTLSTGDIFVLEPNEISESAFLEDTTILVVRNFSDPQDKYIVN